MKNIDPTEVEHVFKEAEDEAARLQQMHLEAAQQAGYAREVFHEIAPFYVKVAEISEDIPELVPIVTSGINLAGTITMEYHSLAESAVPILSRINFSSGSLVTLAAATATTADIVFPGIMDLEKVETPPFFSPNEDETYEKLYQFDPVLASTYREVGQALLATTADPVRAALSCMRQTIDHFFSCLSPDDDVRKSPYWKRKDGNDPLQITRRERITYAINVHIKDPEKARVLFDSKDVVLEAYQYLNQLHKRGALSTKQAYRALKITKTFIETWVDAMPEK